MKQDHSNAGWREVHLLSLFAAIALAPSGYATEPTRFNTGPIKPRTFSFVRMGGERKPDCADNQAEAHALIQGVMDEVFKDLRIAR